MLYAMWLTDDVDGIERQLQQVQHVICESVLVNRSALLEKVLEMRDLLRDERAMKQEKPRVLTVVEAHEKLYPEWDS